MALITRVLPIKMNGFRRQIHTAADALAVRLLRQPEFSIKTTLDSEESSAIQEGGECFCEPLVARLGDFSSRKALLVLEWKLEKLLSEDIRSYDPYIKLIQCSGNLNNILFAIRVFTSIESHGIQPDTRIFNALVSASLSVRNLPTALSLFEIMQWSENAKPDLATYNAFISLYSHLGDGRYMKGWHLAAKQSGFLPDINTYEPLITGFIRLGSFKDADLVYEEMLSSGISPNSRILDSMLEGLCMQNETKRVAELVEFIVKGGFDLSQFSVKNFIRLHFEQRRFADLVALLDWLKPIIDACTDPGIHGSIVRLYALLDKVDDMEYWIERMLNGGMMFTCKEDVEAVISACFRQKAFTRIDSFLVRIKGSYEFAKSTYDILVAGYRKFELYDRLDFVIKEMKGGGSSCNVSAGRS